ncbi:protein phosphatase 2C domain-containing protein [Salinibacterium sp. ZJ77]|uniref:PP2C family protein-serine/threonine phosphatase n=1 Tax=Salinibacterium sp. ZJ77 TaxID=2708337 RepID=UPI001FB8BDE4|nr:protein phosphatase 2C domain-containing protein [Salinibacterium sp. ZJ77]
MEILEDLAIGPATVSLRHAGFTHVGSVRSSNEDSFLAAAPFWVVADGMGGHADGDRASQAAIAAFAAARLVGPAQPSDVLGAVRAASTAVQSLQRGAISGTTLTGVALVDLPGGGPHWMTFNVGDSRTYIWDGSTLTQQSVDHSAVQELLDAGVIDAAAAARHPQRNLVTRALGADPDVEADIWLLPLRGHQMFLVCSDGLTKELDDAEIARIIGFHEERVADGDLSLTLPERLVGAAVAAGGRDNVTVVIVESELRDDRLDPEETLDRDPRLLEDTIPRA